MSARRRNRRGFAEWEHEADEFDLAAEEDAKLSSENGQQVSTLSELREEMRAKARGGAQCDRCGGTGIVHGMAEDEGGAGMASWPCERGCRP